MCIFVETSGPGVESCGIIWVGGVGVFSSSVYISAPLSRVAASVLGFASEVLGHLSRVPAWCFKGWPFFWSVGVAIFSEYFQKMASLYFQTCLLWSFFLKGFRFRCLKI